MKAFFLLFLLSFSNVHAEINWKPFPKNIDKQKIESAITLTSKQFLLEEFADLGPIDLKHINIRVSDIGENYGTYLNGWISLNPKIVRNQDLLTAVLFHEFSHAYDHAIVDRDFESATPEKLRKLTTILLMSEIRAKNKTILFCRKNKIRLPTLE